VDRRDAYRILVEKPEAKGHFEDTGVDRRRVLKRIFKKSDGGRGLD
jgi:hypothetical protein